ncbi:MAG: LuxR C-terminal-related transcriptional regulator, partial [Nostocoides sp.]
ERGRQASEAGGHAAGVLAAFDAGAQLRCQSGHLADVDAELDARDALFDSTDVRLEPTGLGIRAFVAFHHSGPDAALPLLERLRGQRGRSLEMGHGRVWLLAAQSAHLAAMGDQRAALATLRDGWDECIAGEDFIECAGLGVDLARLAMAAGDHETAGRLLPVLDDLARRNPTVAYLAGTATTAAGVLGADCDQLLEGVRLLGTTRRRLAYAGAAQLAAVALAEAGRTPQARPLAESALRAYAEVGADHDVTEAGAAFRRLGLTRGRRTAGPRPTTGWESLTRTEGRVARQVASGLSNPEVAEVLFQSRRTVETHVSHILAKLGLRSRTDLMLFVARRAGELGGASPQ